MTGPTDLEQLLLEYVNDARLDPMGDAARYISSYSPLTSGNSDIQGALTGFGVDGPTLLSQFSALTPAAPVAWNDSLAAASRQHSSLMITDDTQSHQLPGEASFDMRDTSAGYTGFSTLGENIYAYATSDIYAQAGFMIDWGGSAATGGMQSPPGHRQNIMNTSFREVGIGIEMATPATYMDVGPLVITEDFGARFSTGAIILGTAYNDNDHNNFYSVGEGLSTLNVSVGGSSVTSWSSGGFTLMPGVTGTQTVNFSGAGLTGTVSATVALTSSSNIEFEVVNGTTLQTSASATVSGTIDTLMGLGVTGLTLSGGANVRAIIGSKGSDTITGGAGNNTITGGLGNDIIDGGGGVDTAAYSGNRAGYTVTHSNGTYTVAGADGSDTLSHIEYLSFADTTMRLAVAQRDLGSDGRSDLVWQNSDGTAATWFLNGSSTTGGGVIGSNPGTSWHLKTTGDFDDDGKADLAWQNSDGTVAVWLMNGSSVSSGAVVGSNPGTSWKLVGTGDFDGDGKSDLLYQNTNGTAAIWLMNGAVTTGGGIAGSNPGTSWHIKATGDFNGDGKSDILWQNDDGTVAVWLMNGTTVIGGGIVGSTPGASWQVKGAGDFDGDGKSDILWQNTDGTAAIWLMNGAATTGGGIVGSNPGTSWQVMGSGDYNGDGKSDILWQNTDGTPAVWLMNGTTVTGGGIVGSNPGTSWHVVAATGG